MSMIPAEVRERIIKTAQELYDANGREKMPTVDEVRRVARVDMNSASSVMREWRRSQTAQAAPVAVIVPEAVTQAHNTALASLWQVAQELANESLRAAQAGWEVERVEADKDRQELAEAYERQAAELEEVRAAAARSAELHQQQQDARAQELAELRAELAATATRAERAEARAQEIEQRADDLRAELDHAHQEQERSRAEMAAASARAERAEAATQAAEQRAAALAAELAAAKVRSDERAQEAEQRMTAQRIEADAAQAELRAVLTGAQTSAAEARERAAELAGKLEASEKHSAALLARLGAVAKPEQEKKPARTSVKKEPKD